MAQSFAEQRRAIRMALREAEREMIKAQEAKNLEWQEDCRIKQLGLMDAIETIKAVEALGFIFKTQAQS
jgi:hypothetical protein